MSAIHQNVEDRRDPLLARVAFEAIWEHDLRTNRISWGNGLGMFGYARDELGDDASWWWERVHPDDRGSAMGKFEQALGSDVSGWSSEYRFRRRDGSWAWVASRCAIERDAEGRAVRAAGAMIDVSQLKNAEALGHTGSSEDGKPLRAFGTNTDISERKWAEEKLCRHARQQASIANLSLAALRADSLQPIFEEAVALIAGTLGVELGIVLEWLAEKERMEFRAGAGPWSEQLIRDITVPTAPGFMAWFYMRSKAPVVVEDFPRETRFAPCELLVQHGVHSTIAVPIAGKERPYGVLEANSRQVRSFSDDEVNFVWSMANVLATAIEQRRVACELGEKREQLQALSRKLIVAQEDERRAVARELHDELGQILTAIRLNVVRARPEKAETVSLVDGAIARVRELALDLRPPLLDELGLEASLRWYVEREARRAGLEVRLSLAPTERRPPPAVETTSFRVAQEALTNVIRHAQAHCVEIELSAIDHGLQLIVRDDGRGFDVPAARRLAAQGGSQGLLGMQERVALAAGELSIESAPGRGTTVRALLPLAGASGRPLQVTPPAGSPGSPARSP